jgi:hypothetical protein
MLRYISLLITCQFPVINGQAASLRKHASEHTSHHRLVELRIGKFLINYSALHAGFHNLEVQTV